VTDSKDIEPKKDWTPQEREAMHAIIAILDGLEPESKKRVAGAFTAAVEFMRGVAPRAGEAKKKVQ